MLLSLILWFNYLVLAYYFAANGVYLVLLILAAGGIVRLVNGSSVSEGRLVNISLPRDSLSLLQVVEYIRSFLFGRAGLSVINSLLIISGTFSMFQKKTVLAAGGYKTSMVTEDMELGVRLHKHLRDKKQKYRINLWAEADP